MSGVPPPTRQKWRCALRGMAQWDEVGRDGVGCGGVGGVACDATRRRAVMRYGRRVFLSVGEEAEAPSARKVVLCNRCVVLFLFSIFYFLLPVFDYVYRFFVRESFIGKCTRIVGVFFLFIRSSVTPVSFFFLVSGTGRLCSFVRVRGCVATSGTTETRSWK